MHCEDALRAPLPNTFRGRGPGAAVPRLSPRGDALWSHQHRMGMCGDTTQAAGTARPGVTLALLRS